MSAVTAPLLTDESDLPEGWDWSYIGSIFSELRNGTTVLQNKEGKGVPVSRIETLQGYQFNLNRIGHIKSIDPDLLQNFQYRPGDISFSHINSFEHVGKTALYMGSPPVFLHGMNLLRLRLGHSFISPDFLHLYMQSDRFRNDVRDRVTHAVNQVSINQKRLSEVPIPIAPLAEQKRIVTKLEELLARVKAARERLARIPTILKRFRQAVLAALILGPETELGNILIDLKYGTAEKCEIQNKGTPVLRIPNVVKGYVDHSELKYAHLDQKELDSLQLDEGDILLIRSNGSARLLGKTAVVSRKEVGYAYAGYLMRLRCDPRKSDPRYIHLALTTQESRDQIEMPARSTSGVHNINSQEVRRLRIPLPPLEQQREVVRRVDSLFKLADAIEKRVAAATARADKLTQAILVKAFRGELVPTEAELARREGRTYEPASVLLDRIRVEREKSTSPKKAGRSRSAVAHGNSKC